MTARAPDGLPRDASRARGLESSRVAGDVVRDSPRRREDEETRMAALRRALIAGEESGAAEAFYFDALIDAKKS